MRTETENSSVLADLVLDYQNHLRKTKSVDMSNAGFSIKVSADRNNEIYLYSNYFQDFTRQYSSSDQTLNKPQVKYGQILTVSSHV